MQTDLGGWLSTRSMLSRDRCRPPLQFWIWFQVSKISRFVKLCSQMNPLSNVSFTLPVQLLSLTLQRSARKEPDDINTTVITCKETWWTWCSKVNKTTAKCNIFVERVQVLCLNIYLVSNKVRACVTFPTKNECASSACRQ